MSTPRCGLYARNPHVGVLGSSSNAKLAAMYKSGDLR